MKDYIIDDLGKLSKLISDNKINDFERIVLKMNGLSQEEKLAYEKKLNSLSNACGCELGALCCFLSIVFYLIYAISKLQMYNWTILRNGLIVFFISALVGKIIGLAIAQFKFKRTIAILIKKIKKEYR